MNLLALCVSVAFSPVQVARLFRLRGCNNFFSSLSPPLHKVRCHTNAADTLVKLATPPPPDDLLLHLPPKAALQGSDSLEAVKSSSCCKGVGVGVPVINQSGSVGAVRFCIIAFREVVTHSSSCNYPWKEGRRVYMNVTHLWC